MISGIFALTTSQFFNFYAKSKLISDVEISIASFKEVFVESVREPLKFRNIEDLNRTAGFFGRDTVAWLKIKDENKNVVLVQGDIPVEYSFSIDPDELAAKSGIALVEHAIKDGPLTVGYFEAGLNVNGFLKRYKEQKKQAYSWMFLIFIVSLLSVGTTIVFLTSEVRQLRKAIDRFENGTHLRTTFKETAEIYRSFVEKSQMLLKQERKLLESEKLAEIGMISKQVAHDIRAPLTALEIALRDTSGLPSDRRSLLEEASSRIKAIADDLLLKSKGLNQGSDKEFPANKLLSETMEESVFDLRESIIRIVREKSSLISDYEIAISGADGETLVVGEKHAFERALSNLIQNSMEALEGRESPSLLVAVRNYTSQVQVIVADNGKGIPSEVLFRIGEEGFSYDKPDGNGLGVAGAKRKFQEWGGDLHVSSRFGQGTMVAATFRAGSLGLA